MKRMFSLLLILMAAFTGQTEAQNCNADFTFTVVSGLNVHFQAAQSDSPMVHHSWTFGDGSSSGNVHPDHSYAAGGSYTVRHVVYRVGTNGLASCVDSATKVIQLGTTLSCNLVANFSWQVDPQNQFKYYFQNLTAQFLLQIPFAGPLATAALHWI